jgi:replicative DNA helicase
MNKGNYIAAADALDSWRDDVLTGKAPVLYPLGTGGLGRIEVGPGLVTLVGGAPGAGKTAFTMQCVVDALRLSPDLRALVCNIEMPPAVLLDRQLARLSGVDLTTIRHRRIGPEHADRIDQGINTLAAVADRLCFLRPPFDLGNVAAAADDFGASLLVLDYIQRITPPGEHDTRRTSVDATMNYLRQFADAGVAVIVVSAVSRAKDAKGRSSYAGDGLNLASFRESSELEFGADDAFILHPDDDDAEGELVKLKHLKSRHGECRDLSMRFDRRHQTFAVEAEPATVPAGKAEDIDKGKLKALAALWNKTPAASEGGDDE